MSKMTKKSDLNGLSILGRRTDITNRLETFPSHHPERDYKVTMKTDEFTCLCPATGQPDYAKLTIEYIPEERILESKSLKLYLWSFREKGVFHEHVTNVILDEIVSVLDPRFCRVSAEFAVRGGISIRVDAEYKK